MPIRPVKPPPKVRTRTKPKSDDVGYGKPPKEHQFKPGVSGNPKGRPKKSRSQAALLQEILNKEITYVENKRKTKATVRKVLLLKVTDKASKGDLKALFRLLAMDAEYQARTAEATSQYQPSAQEIEAADRAMIARLLPGVFDGEESE